MSAIIEKITGKGLPITGNDIDTDRIIPARFLKCITFLGLGKYVFYDERVDGKGKILDHPFDNPKWVRNSILFVNSNFGCGSSREHAPQALKDYGIRAIAGESFAEIFANNCTAIGISTVTLPHETIVEIQGALENEPNRTFEVDIQNLLMNSKENSWKIGMHEAYRNSMLNGTWDAVSVLSESTELIKAVSQALPYVS